MTRVSTFTAISFRTSYNDPARRFKFQPGMGIEHGNNVLISRIGIVLIAVFWASPWCHDINLFGYDLQPEYNKISVDFQVQR